MVQVRLFRSWWHYTTWVSYGFIVPMICWLKVCRNLASIVSIPFIVPSESLPQVFCMLSEALKKVEAALSLLVMNKCMDCSWPNGWFLDVHVYVEFGRCELPSPGDRQLTGTPLQEPKQVYLGIDFAGLTRPHMKACKLGVLPFSPLLDYDLNDGRLSRKTKQNRYHVAFNAQKH